jgi:hypothetical protein
MLAIPLLMDSDDTPDPACVNVPTGPNSLRLGVEYGLRRQGMLSPSTEANLRLSFVLLMLIARPESGHCFYACHPRTHFRV